jgi:quercetin dioxygenase-like cupin family protein
VARVKDRNKIDINLMKTPLPSSNLVGAISLIGTVVGIATVLFAAQQKQARVTEVVHDVRLLAAQTTARPAAVNDAVREGTAVRTGTDSRAELTFMDQTLTRLGANTVFSFGAAARIYDLGSGAILISAPKEMGTVKITTAVATCAVSGFTAILERHSNTWNKFIILHGNGWLTLKGIPGEPCRLHTGQMVVFPPHPTHYPKVLNIDISKLLNGKLVKGFKGPLPELNIILADIENQQTSPPGGGLIDPTNQDTIDQAMNAHMQSSPPPPPPPRPTIIPSSARF